MSTEVSKPRFTLRELFVVITGIGVLLALLLPAIQGERSSPRTGCNNNLHNIVIALQNYHDTYKMFPMGAMHAGPMPSGNPPLEAGLGPSWWFATMPFTEGRNTYDKIAATQTINGPRQHQFCAGDMNAAGVSLNTFFPEVMRCPKSPLPRSEMPHGPIALPSYVGIAGGCDIDPDSNDYEDSSGVPAGFVAPTTKKIYRNTFKGTGAAAGGIVTSSGMLPPCQHVSIANCSDGTSNTMIVAEQSDWLLDRDPASSQKYHGDPGWTAGGTRLGGGWLSGTRRVDPVPKVDRSGGPPAAWGADCWNITTVRYRPNYKRVMGATPLPGCSENHGINNPLQSAHSGGLQIAMTDGSVQFISQTIDVAVLLRLAIRDDGQQVNLEN